MTITRTPSTSNKTNGKKGLAPYIQKIKVNAYVICDEWDSHQSTKFNLLIQINVRNIILHLSYQLVKADVLDHVSVQSTTSKEMIFHKFYHIDYNRLSLVIEMPFYAGSTVAEESNLHFHRKPSLWHISPNYIISKIWKENWENRNKNRNRIACSRNLAVCDTRVQRVGSSMFYIGFVKAKLKI